jgi:hypothetical protein
MRCALEGAAVRVAPTMFAQNVANSLWALATLGWQAGEGSMRCALEGAAVRVAPSMNAEDVAKFLWALATLGWPSVLEVVCTVSESQHQYIMRSLKHNLAGPCVLACGVDAGRADQGAMLCCGVTCCNGPCATICSAACIVLCDTGAKRADQGARLSVPRLRRQKSLRQAPAARSPPPPTSPVLSNPQSPAILCACNDAQVHPHAV